MYYGKAEFSSVALHAEFKHQVVREVRKRGCKIGDITAAALYAWLIASETQKERIQRQYYLANAAHKPGTYYAVSFRDFPHKEYDNALHAPGRDDEIEIVCHISEPTTDHPVEVTVKKIWDDVVNNEYKGYKFLVVEYGYVDTHALVITDLDILRYTDDQLTRMAELIMEEVLSEVESQAAEA